MTPAEIQDLVRKKKHLTPKEAANITGMCLDYIYDRLGTPKGPAAHKRGNRWKIETWDFVRWYQKPETP